MPEDNIENRAIETPTNLFTKVFLWMFAGLFATGLISYFTYATGYAEQLVSNFSFAVILIIELVVVVIFSLLFKKLSPMGVAILFFIYAVVNGLTLSTIYLLYDMKSIIIVFFVAAALFGIFAFVGGVLKKDISKFGNMLIWVLLALIVISVINIFIGADIIDTIIDWAVLIVFFGITAWDVQKIKMMQYGLNVPAEKIHIYGAMELYLDFINIFLRLLSLFGREK